MKEEELLSLAILPAFGITAGITVIRNRRSGCVYVATEANEFTQHRGENHKHLEIVGDMIKRIDHSKNNKEF